MVSIKSSVKRNAIVTTGCSCNGKSTMAELFELGLNTTNMGSPLFRTDMSDIIKYGMGLSTPLGDEVRECIPIMARGDYVPDEVIKPLFSNWMSEELPRIETRRGQKIELIILAGIPRTLEQTALLWEWFSRVQFITIQATYEQALDKYRNRLAKKPASKRRQDDAGGEVIFKHRWNIYEQQTAPVIKSLGKHVLELNMSDSLETRLKQTFQHFKENASSPVSKNAANRALFRLNSKIGQIWDRIQEIQSPPPTDAVMRYRRVAAVA